MGSRIIVDVVVVVTVIIIIIINFKIKFCVTE